MKATENPFRSSVIDKIRYRMPEAEMDRLVRKIEASSFRKGSLVGPEGTGKSTLMEALGQQLGKRNQNPRWLGLNGDSTRPEKAAVLGQIRTGRPGNVYLLDGGEVLSRWDWYRLQSALQKSGARLIATLHRDRGLPVLFRTRPDWPVVRSLVEELAGSALTPALRKTAEAAYHQHQGNAREVFRECYWHCALQPA